MSTEIECPHCEKEIDAYESYYDSLTDVGWTEVECIYCEEPFSLYLEYEPYISGVKK